MNVFKAMIQSITCAIVLGMTIAIVFDIHNFMLAIISAFLGVILYFVFLTEETKPKEK